MSEPNQILTSPTGPLEVPAPPVHQRHAFEFDGQAGEYCRIWIVNLFLTIATFGIYSAWAKVRTQRYFAASTRLAGSSFDYLADPLAILKGRLLVFGFILLYYGSSFIDVTLQAGLSFALFLVFPWAIIRSLAFRAHNTAWRGIRLHFDAPYSRAFNAYLGFPILGMLSLGALYPYALFRERQFVVGHASFGQTPFEIASGARDFYAAAVAFILHLAVAGIFLAVVMGGAVGVFGDAVAPLGMILAVPIYFYVFAFLASRITHLTYDGTRLGPHRLHSDLPAGKLAATYAVNALAILASLGLMIPWAQIRLARLRLDHLALEAEGDLDAFVAKQSSDVASFGSEVGEALGIDIGL